ncbi:MAG: dipicolinate synthase [Oscillospiraceae bacterium]|nr:dipicolinate synthase [Oscillospiraceae bacterium]
MAYLARLLAEDGYEVRTWGVPGEHDTGRPGTVTEASRVILPAPLEKDGRLNGTPLTLGELWPRMRPGTPVYAGAVPQNAFESARERGIPLFDYLADEALAVRNAVPTAEGAIALAMEKLNVTLHGTACLVMGFGRIGKLLAHGLRAFGANVYVSARRGGDLAWAEALGYEPLHTRRLSGKLGGMRVVFNTVPHLILTEELLRELPRECVLIELASVPGIDEAAAQRLGFDYSRAGGLPGKVAPESAARAIRDTLYGMWREEK